jgi:hypothetical protein
MTCQNGTFLGSCTNPVVNAMRNRQPPRSSVLLILPRAPKALLFPGLLVCEPGSVSLGAWDLASLGILLIQNSF